MADLLTLQNSYAANARVMSMVKGLMDAWRPYSDIVRAAARVYKPAAPGGVTSRPRTTRQGVSGMLVKAKNYRPSDKEPFMNERQRDYFRAKLLAWREDILKEAKETLQHLQEENQNHPDLADRASSETDRAIELRARDRQRKLIAKIDEALGRLEDGTYGYCEETGEPISLRRLEARPIATLSVEAQERHERRERVYRDD
jgi:DnaK suppressor protein